MTITGVHHVAVQVNDLERSRSFYVDVLGLKEVRRQPHSLWVQAGDALVMLEKCSGEAPPPAFNNDAQGLHLLALRIPAAARESWRKRLTHAGFPVVHETGFTLYVRDPDGARIALSHYPEQ